MEVVVSTIYTYTGELTVVECANCEIAFAVPVRFEENRREDHQTFYCPRGHYNYYPHKTDKEKLRQQLAAAQGRVVHERDQREAVEKSLRATKGHLTRVKKRVSHGVCPFCNRHFNELEAHVATKHPEQIKKDA
jgi:hypothetical protein